VEDNLLYDYGKSPHVYKKKKLQGFNLCGLVAQDSIYYIVAKLQ